MPEYVEYKHKGTMFNVRYPLEWDEFDDHIEIDDIKFVKMANLIGFFEIFSRNDYNFGGLKDIVFIDVGANIADSTLYIASMSDVKKVYAYEPFPNVAELAKKNLELNPDLKSKTEFFEFGWFDGNKTIEAEEIDDINASALNTIVPDFSDVYKQETHNVKIVLKKSSEILQNIIDENKDSPIVLKMDIEGSEYECIKDIAKNNLLKDVDMLFVEWHLKGYKQITDILEEHNFVWTNENLSPKAGFIRAFRK